MSESTPHPLGWTERLYQTLPMAPIWVGVAIAAGLLALFVGAAWVSGGVEDYQAREASFWEYREIRIAFLVALLAGYLPTARRYVVQGAERNLEDLRPLVAEPWEPVKRRFGRLDGRMARTSGALGLLIVPVSALAIDRDPGLYLLPGYWGPETGFGWVVGAIVGWSLGRFVYATLGHARRFSDLADQLASVDLLDLRALVPFGRQGLLSALLWLVLISFLSLNAQDLAWFAAVGVVAVLGGTTALILPVRGVHRCLRRTKQAELDRVHAAIRGDREALRGSLLGPREAPPALSDLLAYRAFVESVREWPFDSPTLLRFGLYLAIPLGSWLGGAFVERLLGAALD